MLYLDIRNEVKTNKLIHECWKKNKTVLIPVTDPSDAHTDCFQAVRSGKRPCTRTFWPA
jgi:5-formyltetrahydrofolate cyclo-ligase